MNQLIVLSAIVLLPLIPSFLLFKLLPSHAIVKGPLAGLNVSLGGAFGGYVALTVFVATFFAQNVDKPTTWHVRGKLQFPTGQAAPAVITCDVHPPVFGLRGTNDFEVEMPLDDKGAAPSLVFSANGYDAQTVYLASADGRFGGSHDAKRYSSTGIIDVRKPIVFTKSPAYQPPAQIAEGGKP